jgi:hypothetical protein
MGSQIRGVPPLALLLSEVNIVLCIQCSLKAFVKGEQSPVFEETIAEHMRRVHPDPEVTQLERMELERKAAAIISAIERRRT